MPCEPFVTADGKGRGFICSRGSRRQQKPCVVCGEPGNYLCDYPLKGDKEGQTCDRPMCRHHAKLIKHDTHYCPAHVRAAEEAGEL